MKDIIGYEGLYAITSCGKVWSYKRCCFLTPRFNESGYLRVQLIKNGKRKNKTIHRLVAEAFIPNLDDKPQVSHKDECKTHNWVNNLEWATSKENNNMPLRKKRGSDSHKGDKNSFYGKKHSAESRNKMSQARIGRFTGENNPNFGKTCPSEVRAKISNARIGKYCGDKNPMYGRTGKNNPNSQPVYCPQLDQIFDCAADVERRLGICASSVNANCNGTRKSAGKHPITGEKLTWQKYNTTK